MKIMNIKNKIACLTLGLIVMAATACTGDLDRFPGNDGTDKEVYNTFDGYKSAIAKVYGGYTLTGNAGPDGNADIGGLDEGSYADFLRGFFNAQELPTEEAMCIWNDDGISGLNYINFSASNPFARGLYNRCMMQIMYANSFIKNSTEETVSTKGFTDAEATEIKYFNAEARFLRAFQYWAMMDLYGNPPFVDENTILGELPKQIQRADLFNYVESELLEIQNLLPEPRQNEYGRADKAAVWALLARLYLNAEIYTKTARYTDAITYSQKVIAAGYVPKTVYEELFLADNHLNNDEVILSINYDGIHTRNHAGITFLINSSFTEKLQTDYNLNYGITTNAAWGGNRTRGKFSEKFDDADTRKLLVGSTPIITDVTDFNNGLATYKYRNITAAGNAGSNTKFADNDFPLFRLAETYLIYAEAVKRGGTGGNEANALTYMNKLRERAFGNATKNYGSFAAISLDEILDERARELYWECHRRTDLVRYGYFTTARYLWDWKGGAKDGRSVSNHYNIYPIPNTDMSANPNLKQNPNY